MSKIRLRYGLDVFRRFVEVIVEQCQQAKLVWGRELYFDSSAASTRMPIWIRLPRVLWWRHEKRFKSILLPTMISESRREELTEENTARHDWIAEEGRQQRDVYGSYQRTADCGHQYHRS